MDRIRYIRVPSNENSGLKSCISTTGAILGIITALITIIKFFFTDADTFFTALGEFWLSTFLGKIWPEAGNMFGNASHAFKEFAQSSPFTPWWTAILVFIVGGAASIAIHFFVFDDEFNLMEVPIVAIPALLWIWVFYGTIPIWGIAVFIVVYILILVGLAILADTL